MRKIKTLAQAIEYLDSKKGANDCVDEAILLVAHREGLAREDDWELMEAAEVLAREVSDLRDQISAAKYGL